MTREEAKKVFEYLEERANTQEPRDDAISREAVCDYIAEFVNNEYSTQAECEMVDLMIEGIQHLPSVTHKSGKWIGIDEEPHEDYECSCCGYVVSTFTANIEPHTEYKYCPNCGAKMESEEINGNR